MNSLTKAFRNISITEITSFTKCMGVVRYKYLIRDEPVIGVHRAYRRIVHYPEKYTVKPLEVTNLGGRDPATGRLAVKGIGGGIKHKYHWIDWVRTGPKDNSPPREEKVIKIIKDGCRTANVALVAYGDQMRYYLATVNMKEGDILRTSSYIPRIPVRPNEGDAYPLGALPIGTQVNCVEKYPGTGGFFIHAAGTFATIVRKAPNNHVVIAMPSKREFSLPAICMCTVGRLSNVEHSSTPIGSAQKNRELGNRPRSGWWQRKSGKHGRKIRKPPPVRTIEAKQNDGTEYVRLTTSKVFVKKNNIDFYY